MPLPRGSAQDRRAAGSQPTSARGTPEDAAVAALSDEQHELQLVGALGAGAALHRGRAASGPAAGEEAEEEVTSAHAMDQEAALAQLKG